MHCPRCGQQQVSEVIKFCSRCGLPLVLIAEVVAHDGFLPQLAEFEKNKKRITRNLGLKISLLWFLITTFILLPLSAITDAPEEIVVSLAILGVCGSIVMALLSWMFLTNNPKITQIQDKILNENVVPNYLSGNSVNPALPPQTTQPVSSYNSPQSGSWKAPETGELIPHSVTDNTTKLLHKEEKF
jgi:hypothetical protein